MFEKIEEVIVQEMERDRLPGLAIAVVKGREIVWSQGYGYTDLESKTPVSPSTVFSVQSVTKPVVATALMQWYERGRFELDDPVNDHLGPVQLQNEFEGEAPVTVRHLLTHTGGLPVDIGASVPPGGGQRTLEEHVASVAKTVRRPGEDIVYANRGYDTIGYLIERFAGRPWDAYVKDEVLEPLGMGSSAIGQPPDGAQAARGYFLSAVDGQHHVAETFPWPTSSPSPAGSLFSTVEDLGRFLMAHLNGGVHDGRRVLGESSVTEMQSLQAPAGPSGGGMGLGFRVDRANGRHFICHGGDGPGWTAFIGAYPEEKVGVALLINMGRAGSARSVIGSTALRLLAGDFHPHDVRALKRDDASDAWNYITGRYLSSYWDINADVTVDDGALVVRGVEGLAADGGGAESHLEEIEPCRFRAHGGFFDGFELAFEYGEGGRAERFYGGLYPFRFERQGDLVAGGEAAVDEEAELAGRWSGTVSSPLGPLPVSLAIADGTNARVTALSASNSAVDEFEADRGSVAGHFDVIVPGFGEFRVFLRLKAMGSELRGRAYARSSWGEFPMPVEMRRE